MVEFFKNNSLLSLRQLFKNKRIIEIFTVYKVLKIDITLAVILGELILSENLKMTVDRNNCLIVALSEPNWKYFVTIW